VKILQKVLGGGYFFLTHTVDLSSDAVLLKLSEESEGRQITRTWWITPIVTKIMCRCGSRTTVVYCQGIL